MISWFRCVVPQCIRLARQIGLRFRHLAGKFLIQTSSGVDVVKVLLRSSRVKFVWEMDAQERFRLNLESFFREHPKP